MADKAETAAERNAVVIEQFRAAGGRGQLPNGMNADRLVLLTHRGAHTGRTRTTPMMLLRVWGSGGARLVVVASNAGAERHPDWFRNVVADPEVTVEVSGQRRPATAIVLDGDSYRVTWDAVVAQAPFFADHQAGVRRRIPLVELAERV
jgi:deazaflavin-dependent oxidoreductase (nitroreductase family)